MYNIYFNFIDIQDISICALHCFLCKVASVKEVSVNVKSIQYLSIGDNGSEEYRTIFVVVLLQCQAC